MVLLKRNEKKKGIVYLGTKKEFLLSHIITWCAMFLEMSLREFYHVYFEGSFLNCQYGFIFTEVILESNETR
jgi:hypothetical protein